MNKLLALLLKVPSSLALGCVIALGLMQNDPWLKTRIERFMVQSATELIGESFHVTVSGIDLLSTSYHHTLSLPSLYLQCIGVYR